MSQEIPQDPSNHPHEHESQAKSKPLPPNLPLQDLIKVRSNYLKIGVPLYEASIKCDWKAAEAILDRNKDLELVKCSITDNGETALHIAASAKGPKKVEEFVKNLVARMTKEDLALENKNHNTALYLAAAAGNIKTVEIMLAKNQTLHIIPGAGRTMMPLYAAVLFGNKDVVKHLYKLSKDLCDDGWNHQNRSWLLEKCVESDMFDIAIKIVQKYPELGRSNPLLGLLARKPEAFSEKKSNMIGRSIKLGGYIYSSMFTTHQPSEIQQSEPQSASVPKNSAQHVASPNTKSNIIGRAFKSVSAFFVGEPEKETEALRLLRIIWGDILTLSKRQIDNILRGSPDPMKPAKGWVLQAIQLKDLISEQLEEMENTYKSNQDVRQLKKLVSRYVLKMHTETQNIITEENKTRSSKGDQALELEKILQNCMMILRR